MSKPLVTKKEEGISLPPLVVSTSPVHAELLSKNAQNKKEGDDGIGDTETVASSPSIGSHNFDTLKSRRRSTLPAGVIANGVYDITKPLHYDCWIRSLDPQGQIFFYNVRTGESSWLGPCCLCYRPAAKYCVDCSRSFCDKDFKIRHEKESRQMHKWQLTDVADPDKLHAGESYCIECCLRTAAVVCTDCWNSFCANCFDQVHFVGALKKHKKITVAEAKKGWTCVRGAPGKEHDYYVSRKGITTYDKPVALMTELEKTLASEFRFWEAESMSLVDKIAQLQFELEAAKYERDRTVGDTTHAIKELHLKAVEKEKQAAANVLDVSKIKANQGFFEKLFGSSVAQQVYKQKLLNPHNRRRGEARTEYIRQVIEVTSVDYVTGAKAATGDNSSKPKRPPSVK
jgi:hypothetical protein